MVKGGPQPPPYTADPVPDEIDVRAEAGSNKTSGKGYVLGGVGFINAVDSSVSCPRTILSDISRLEVLMDGKRTGNNSPEIINEAADICMRLFQGGIMSIDIYQKLIDELVENHGYFSD